MAARKAKAMMTVTIYDNGAIKVGKGDGKAPKQLTQAQFKKSLEGKKIKNTESLTVIQSNPCTWINIRGKWYHICW